jgi:hypothetical protein
VVGYEEPDERCVRICPASASDVWSMASEMELTVFVGLYGDFLCERGWS